MAEEQNGVGTLPEEKLAELTAQIVSAYVANNSLPPSELPSIIKSVAGSLQGEKKVEEPAKVMPAVPVRKSVAQDHLVCLVCGKNQKTLKRHLATAHGMSPVEYREQFGLNRDYPMVAPSYSSARSEMAKQIGLGQKGRARRAAQAQGRAAGNGRRRRTPAPARPTA